MGAFTREGTFEAIIVWLGELKDPGVPAIELMHVAQFRGTMNWAARRVEEGPEFSRPSLCGTSGLFAKRRKINP